MREAEQTRALKSSLYMHGALRSSQLLWSSFVSCGYSSEASIASDSKHLSSTSNTSSSEGGMDVNINSNSNICSSEGGIERRIG